MKINACIFLITLTAFTVLTGTLKAQTTYNNPDYNSSLTLRKTKTTAILPFAVGVAAVLYLINPIIVYEDKKIYAGITKEISLGWGKMGQHRTAFEYSFILGGNIRHYVRLSYKYDFLLKDGIEPSHTLQGTPTLSVGGGFFTDFNGTGAFPEITYGYSLRNHKLLFYPHIKLRHTFTFRKDKPDNTDISFGIIVGFANPFMDVDIRRKY